MDENDVQEPTIVVTKDGPYRITGPITAAYAIITPDDTGASWTWVEGEQVPVTQVFEFCRCGHSTNKPFCDGSHRRHGFSADDGASTEPYESLAKVYDGPTMQLGDAEELCAFARFCDGRGSAWRLVAGTGEQEARELLAHEATHCPSGRLVAYDKESLGAAVEPDLPASIGIVEDPAKGVSGGYWVRGGVRIELADGTVYPTRNRVTLCRCGHSSNKPFCDGSHAKHGFRDEALPEAAAVGADSVETPEV